MQRGFIENPLHQKKMKCNGDEENASSSGADQEIDHDREEHGRRLEQAADSGYSSNPDRKHHLTSISKEVTPPPATEKIPEKSSRDLSSNHKSQEDQLESARVEMGEVREENERLKSLLSEIVKDYQSLQKHVRDVLRQGEALGKPAIPTPPVWAGRGSDRESDELAVTLTLGRTLSSTTKTEGDRKIDLNEAERDVETWRKELKLGLGFRCSERSSGEPARDHSYRESLDEPKEDEIAEIWPPSKILRTVKSADDESSQPTQVKKARVSVRVRCDTPTMNDGCQWRKYGQKLAKGNPCPRAYYRCTVSPSCPVRKQVQRCAEDMSILIMTYEGNHNHPLPVSATAMASTTAAAASILRSQSSSSSQQDREAPTATSNSSISTTSASLHGLSFSSIRDSKPNQLYFPSSSISTCNSHPTITLDLTTPINPSNYNRFSSSSSPCLDFSAPASFGSSQLLAPWHSSSFLNYGANPINRSIQFQEGAPNLGRQAIQEHPLKPYLQMSGLTSSSSSSQQSLMTDTIVAATKAIATNPSFHSALAAALSSSCNGDGSGYRDKAESFDQLKYLKPGGTSSADSVQIPGQSRAACASNFISNLMNVNFQRQGGS